VPELDFDLQAWLDCAAGIHMAAKSRGQLHGCLDGPLPRQVRMSNVTVVVVEEDAPTTVISPQLSSTAQM